MLHRILTLLLCACLALQGASVALASEVPCPMAAEMEALVLAGELNPADLSDCCNDLQAWAETGSLCKTGVDCQGMLSLAPAATARAVATAASSGHPVGLTLLAPTAPPGAPWRPPSAG